MIERAVFSYLNSDESFNNKAGFRCYSDFLYTIALATHLAGRHFKSVQIVTSSWGGRVLQQAGITATEYSNELDSLKEQKLFKWFWAYGKLLAYSIQTQPFIHIDNDVFLWKPLPKQVLDAELCFQSKEFLNVHQYRWYDLLKPCWEKAVIRPQVIVNNEVTDFAYNCGICGGHNLEFFKKWIKCSSEYLFAPENQTVFFDEFRDILHHQNLFHEQYFAASLIKAQKRFLFFFKKKYKVETIADNVCDLMKATDEGYTHYWGGTKTGEGEMRRAKLRLEKEAPDLFEKVTLFCKLNNLDVEKKERYITARVG